ncbi:hypothetical protein BGX38DRAFT_1134485, partial [Terfezia claveryi]
MQHHGNTTFYNCSSLHTKLHSVQENLQALKTTLTSLGASSESLKGLDQIQHSSHQLTAQVALHQHHTEQLQSELNKQRGGKHDRRILSKARVVTEEYLMQRKVERDNELAKKEAKRV